MRSAHENSLPHRLYCGDIHGEELLRACGLRGGFRAHHGIFASACKERSPFGKGDYLSSRVYRRVEFVLLIRGDGADQMGIFEDYQRRDILYDFSGGEIVPSRNGLSNSDIDDDARFSDGRP